LTGPVPHPARHLDDHGVLRNVPHEAESLEAVPEHESDEDNGDDGPDDLQQEVALYLLGFRVPVMPVPDREPDHQGGDENQEEHTDDHHEQEGAVHRSYDT